MNPDLNTEFVPWDQHVRNILYNEPVPHMGRSHSCHVVFCRLSGELREIDKAPAIVAIHDCQNRFWLETELPCDCHSLLVDCLYDPGDGSGHALAVEVEIALCRLDPPGIHERRCRMNHPGDARHADLKDVAAPFEWRRENRADLLAECLAQVCRQSRDWKNALDSHHQYLPLLHPGCIRR